MDRSEILEIAKRLNWEITAHEDGIEFELFAPNGNSFRFLADEEYLAEGISYLCESYDIDEYIKTIMKYPSNTGMTAVIEEGKWIENELIKLKDSIVQKSLDSQLQMAYKAVKHNEITSSIPEELCH